VSLRDKYLSICISCPSVALRGYLLYIHKIPDLRGFSFSYSVVGILATVDIANYASFSD
jgi:hypothetical protein